MKVRSCTRWNGNERTRRRLHFFAAQWRHPAGRIENQGRKDSEAELERRKLSWRHAERTRKGETTAEANRPPQFQRSHEQHGRGRRNEGKACAEAFRALTFAAITPSREKEPRYTGLVLKAGTDTQRRNFSAFPGPFPFPTDPFARLIAESFTLCTRPKSSILRGRKSRFSRYAPRVAQRVSGPKENVENSGG